MSTVLQTAHSSGSTPRRKCEMSHKRGNEKGKKTPRKSCKNLEAAPRSSWCVRSRPWWLWVCSPGVDMCNICWLTASSMVIPCPCVHPQAHYVRWGCQDVDRRRKCVASGWKSKYLGETLPAQFLGTGLFGFAFQEPKNQKRWWSHGHTIKPHFSHFFHEQNLKLPGGSVIFLKFKVSWMVPHSVQYQNFQTPRISRFVRRKTMKTWHQRRIKLSCPAFNILDILRLSSGKAWHKNSHIRRYLLVHF